jgi:hypothetical protein
MSCYVLMWQWKCHQSLCRIWNTRLSRVIHISFLKWRGLSCRSPLLSMRTISNHIDMPLWQSSIGCRNQKETHSCCLSFQRDFHLSIKGVIHKSTYKVRVSTGANYLLNHINIVGSNLTGRIKPPGRACSRRYDDSAALELAHAFIVHFNSVHARAWHVFLCCEHFI